MIGQTRGGASAIRLFRQAIPARQATINTLA
jgi:hypothetical protein